MNPMLPVYLLCSISVPLRYSLAFICPASCTLFCKFLWIVLCHCPFCTLKQVFSCVLYPMLPVSLDCLFSLPLPYSLIFICPLSYEPYAASFFWIVLFNYPSVLSSILLSSVKWTLSCQFIWIFMFHYPLGILYHWFVMCLVYPMLPVSLDSHVSLPLGHSLPFICPVSCVSSVASLSGLSFIITPSVFSNMYMSCVLCILCCQFLWIVVVHCSLCIIQLVFVLCLVNPMLPGFLDCPLYCPFGIF